MADFVASLIEMGFEKERAEKAVEVTGNRGIEPAMEWLFTNADDKASCSSRGEGGGGSSSLSLSLSSTMEVDGPQSGDGVPPTNTDTAPINTPEVSKHIEVGVPQSYKCEDCGKLFKNMETVEFHAAKTKHSNFSESSEEKKPLTDEEKIEQKRLLQELLKQKRAEREARENREELEREKIRMTSGKELLEAKRRMEEAEMKQIAEQRRQEKLDDKRARDRVKAQIEADKIARKARFAEAGSAGGGSANLAASPIVVHPKASDSQVPPVKKDYSQTKLQVRLPSGKTLVQSFGVNEPLASVRLYVELNRDDGVSGPFNFMTNFPKRVYEGEDYDVPLDALGLVPSAVLMVTKSV